MKKILFIILLLLISISNCSALTLDCSKTLSYGSTGNDVKNLQKLLNTYQKCNLTVDGIFGNQTKSCVKAYQTKNKLSSDGIVGPITCKSLNGKNTTKTNSATNNTNTNSTTTSSTKYGIVTGDYVNIRSNASLNASIISSANIGKTFQVISKQGDWYKIKYSSTKNAYIYSDYLKLNYVLVDISDQKVYFYKNGQKKWTANVVTGMKNVHDTPIGVYTLNKRNFSYKVTLSGNNDNGTRYNAPVDYWMPFIFTQGIGFHDASWRSNGEFNNREYINNGSHGCVNMKHSDAEKLYNEDYNSITVVVRK